MSPAFEQVVNDIPLLTLYQMPLPRKYASLQTRELVGEEGQFRSKKNKMPP
jgi:hypothetical protein